MASSTNYRCSLCGFERGTVPLPNKSRVCMRCMALAIGKLQDAVYQNRPTYTDMNEATDKAIRPLSARITALELQLAALCEVLDGRARRAVRSLPGKFRNQAAPNHFRAWRLPDQGRREVLVRPMPRRPETDPVLRRVHEGDEPLHRASGLAVRLTAWPG